MEAIGLPDLGALWQVRIDRGELTDRVAARLIAVGAAYPNDALVWLAANRLELAQSSATSVRLVIDDDDVDDHGIVLNGTIAETLGRNAEVPVQSAKLLVGLLDRQRA